MMQTTVQNLKLTLILLAVYFFVMNNASAAREQPKLGYRMSELSSPVTAPSFILEDMVLCKYSTN